MTTRWLRALRRMVADAGRVCARLIVFGLIMFGLFGSHQAACAAQAQVKLSGQVQIARLIDLCSERLGFAAEYDDKAMQGLTASLRGVGELGDVQLWELTNQLLAARGFTTVSPLDVESSKRAYVTVVKLGEAAGLARVETPDMSAGPAGYRVVELALRRLAAKQAAEIIKPLLSKPGGVVQEVGDGRRLLIGDFPPRVDQHLRLLDELDGDEAEIVIEQVTPSHVAGAQLAAALTAAATARAGLGPPLQGKVIATGLGGGVMIVAPRRELDQWKRMSAQLDQRQTVHARSYAVPSFGLDEVADLVEQAVRLPSPQGSGEQWRVVKDSLTNLLIVTATQAEHERLDELMGRLASMPAESRKPMRSFPIRNRSVADVLTVVSQLLDAGALETESSSPTPGPASGLDPQETDQSEERQAPVEIASGAPGGREPDVRDGTAHAGPTSSAVLAVGKPLFLTADVATNTLIAVGTPRLLTQVEQLLKTLDVRQPQVMVEVLVLSLSEADTRDLGVELEKLEFSGGTVIRLSSLFGLGAPGLDAGAEDIEGSGFSGLVLHPGDFRVLIRALQTLNQGRALNVPKVLVSNNQQATLDSVLQQPFVSTNASDTVATTSFGGFENAGTTVTVRPQIASGDHLLLEYAVMLSAFVGESADAGIPPPRQQNKLQSVVTVPDGFTVALGGIEIANQAEAVTQVPLLGDVPLLGELFKNRSKSLSRSKFYVFIRPSVMRREGFEDLKFMSGSQWGRAGLDEDGAAEDAGFNAWPEVLPQVIR